MPLRAAPDGKLWQIIFLKPVYAVDLNVIGISSSLIIRQLAQEKQLIGVEDIRRVGMLVAIISRQQLDGAAVVARLFPYLADDALSGAFADVRPPTGQCPAVVVHFLLYQQNPLIAEEHAAHVYFRRGMSHLRLK